MSAITKAYEEARDSALAPQESPIKRAFNEGIKSTGLDIDTTSAITAGADPETLAFAKAHLGKKEYQGYCQKFTRLSQGINESQGGTAIEAWNNIQNKKPGLSGINPGDPLYFSANASNEGMGHTGIYSGNNKFISATDNGIKEYSIPEWQQMTNQSIMGYVPGGNNATQ